MKNTLKNLLADVLKIPADRITDSFTMSMAEEWDSLKHMELIVTLEESFQAQFSFDEIVRMRSLEDILNILDEKEITGP
jgi:acyl carrier protein